MWAFTGHVAYSYDCERWKHGCGSCPYLGEYPALSRDTTAALWRWKDEVYKRSRLTIVAPSRWIEGLAPESPLLSRFPVRRIPNGIDLDRFRPVDRARRRGGGWSCREEGPVVLFSAPDVSDRRKGGAVLNEALEHLHDEPFQLLLAGANETPPSRARSARSRTSSTRTRSRSRTRPPTCSCSRRSRRTSRTRRSRASPAGRRASRSTSAACRTSCATSRPATSRRSATPPGWRRASGRCSRTTSCAARMSARCRELAEEEFGARARGVAVRRAVRRARRLDVCGLAGVVGAPDDALLERLGEALRHRGPDGGGDRARRGGGRRARRAAARDPRPRGRRAADANRRAGR